jgi:SAM-dependent methyltransferase
VKTAHLIPMALRGLMPFSKTLRQAKRRLCPYEDNEANSQLCISNGLQQLAALREAAIPLAGVEVLEFGSGWLPLIPMLFHLAGAKRLILTDIERLMDSATIDLARNRLHGRIDEIASVLLTSRETVLARLQGPFPHDYLVPWAPAGQLGASIDLIISRAVFEHVPAAALEAFIAQFHRILRPGGAMCHLIDNSDHWQHRDRALSRLDFLRYEDDSPIWRLAQINAQAFQNRLRHAEYRRMFEVGGFQVVLEQGCPDQKCLDDLSTLPLAGRFRGMAAEDLAVLTSLFVVRKPA